MNLTEQQFKDILSDDSAKWDGDNAIQGLLIIAKYFDVTKTTIVCAAEHDIIYSVGLFEIIEAGLTLEDAKALRKLNWMEQYDSLACFV